ncbi:uncharacterized protein LOC110976948 isoform X2 [Acanthaster planci]|uniref:Uncharacterized protein LOC110976948 isoform X2 n=1 Tax=Acanthaster planci TaxID=133434 RepID=A0A8B7Y1I9_ACAPL|nr:uncharacterized protein LOC110976948 isoform X2 [Acanthaster planci]
MEFGINASIIPRLPNSEWSEDETRRFLELRRKYITNFFTGKRGSIQKTYAVILEEMGLTGKVTPMQARKKWNNMSQLYRRLLNQPAIDAGDGKEYVPVISWPFFRDVEQTIEVEPQIVEAPAPQQFEGTSLEELSEQINARILQETIPAMAAEGEQVDSAAARKRTRRQKRAEALGMIAELHQLNKRQEEILAAKNDLSIKLLTLLA